MGVSKQYLGSYSFGFFVFAALALLVLGVMRVMQIRWTRTWAEKGGRARLQAAPIPVRKDTRRTA
jgi:NNP family nitrate/nitrite transporter-like MFS transporter